MSCTAKRIKKGVLLRTDYCSRSALLTDQSIGC
nr:MAG TPA: hypothetical protein [Microviridae sp.]